MSRRLLQDDRAPWSFFVPVLLAVACGVLVADGVRYAVGVVFADRLVSNDARDAAQTNAAAARAAASAVASTAMPTAPVAAASPATARPELSQPGSVAASTQTDQVKAPSAALIGPSSPAATAAPPAAARHDSPATDAAVTQPAALLSTRQAADSVERLPGSTTARRDKLPRACINGTVAARDNNGWQQELSSDRPVRCEQTSP